MWIEKVSPHLNVVFLANLASITSFSKIIITIIIITTTKQINKSDVLYDIYLQKHGRKKRPLGLERDRTGIFY